jgi:hypothetical protein
MTERRLPNLDGIRISSDGDGVTIDSVEWMVRFLNKCAGTSYRVTDISSFGIIRKWALDAGLSQEVSDLSKGGIARKHYFEH